MNPYVKEHEARKEKVLDFLEKTIQFLDGQADAADTVEALQTYRRNVAEGLFSIVLVGEFSAGKSTFLNALMRRRILPSYSSETTATVNYLRHITQAPNHEAGIVCYRDGHQEALSQLTVSELERVVSTRGDTDAQKVATSVDHVDLFLDSPLLQDGVMLIDSPGLNGVADHHREITERQIKASHASIFMFSARQPGSKSDFEYLRSLKSQSGNIFLVLNMIDVINPEQETVEDVVAKLRDNYRTQFPDEKTLPEIWPVSAEAALVARDCSITTYKNVETISTQERREELERFSRMEALENRLWQYLTQGERTRAQLLGPVERCQTILKEQRDFLQKQIDLLRESRSAEELQAQRDALEAEIQTLTQNRQSVSSDLRQSVQEKLKEILDRGEAGCIRILKEVELAIDTMDSPEDLSDYSDTLQQRLEIRYQRLGAQMKDAMREALCQLVQDEYDSWFVELEEQLTQDAVQLEIPLTTEPLTLTQGVIRSNLAQFEAWCTAKREEIDRLEAEANQKEDGSLDAKLAEKNREEAKAELKLLRERQTYLADHFSIPDVVYRSEDVIHKERRGGLFGLIGTLLFGKKAVTRSELVADSSARDAAVSRQKALEEQLQQEECQLREDLEQLPIPPESSERLAMQAMRLRRKQAELEQEYQEKQKQFMATLDKNTEKACKKMRAEIIFYVEQSQDTYMAGLRHALEQMKSGCIQAVRDLLNVNLNQQLTRTQQKLDELIALIQTEGAQREQQLAEAVQREQLVVDLLHQGAELSVSLETQMNDKIHQEDLQV